MEISKTFVVAAPPDVTWQFLTDPRRVAQCLPGAAITEQLDERTHAGTVTMKVGPVTAAFKGTLRFDRIDAATHTAEIVATGQDVRGKGGADMRMASRLIERAPGETEVTITSNVKIVGTLAQFGRGIIQDVSDQIFDRFVGAVRAELETAVAAAAVPASLRASTPVGSVAVLPELAAPASIDGLRASVDEGAPRVLPSPADPVRAVAPPLDVLSTASGVIGRAGGRTARRPLVWVGVFVVLLLMYMVLGR